MHKSTKMQQCVRKASGSGGLIKLSAEEEWAGKVVHFMDDKKVSELPLSPKCPSLIALYLEGNYELTAIPPLFFQRMAFLQILDLSRTSIKSFPKSLPKLVALKKLLLRSCDLFMELSPYVGKLKNLEELDLDETQIMDLPREIGKLINLRHLRVSFYPICGKKKLKSNIVIHPDSISNLSQLTELSIDVNPADKRWDDSVEAVVKEVCNSKTLRTLNLYLPKFQLLDYTSSIYPSLSRFRFIVGHIKRRIISRVPQEVEAQFRSWYKCLKFVNGENIPTQIKGLLKHSNSFFLDNHATVMNLSEFGIENMKRLKFCLLAECNKMETIIDGERHSEGSEDHDRSKSDPRCVENVVLESLEYLNIYYLENLVSIWRGPTSYGCMSKLKFLSLHTCPQLSIVFSHSLLENLVNLEEFILEDCPLVTTLVSQPSVKPMMSDKFLPSLKRLLLVYLPELVSISSGLLIAPKLESIGFYNCPKLRRISKMELSSKNLKKIKGERQWWEVVRWNETRGGGPVYDLMHIFSPIRNEEDAMTQLAEHKNPNPSNRSILQAPSQSSPTMASNSSHLAIFISSLMLLSLAFPSMAAYGDNKNNTVPTEKKTEVVVEGVVYCQSCDNYGSWSLSKAEPIPSAKVSVICKTAEGRVSYYKAFEANGNGYFFAELKGFQIGHSLLDHPLHACHVKLLSSPLESCNLFTNVNYGINGSPLRYENKRLYRQDYDMVIYAAGPLAFRPAHCPAPTPTHY